MSVDTVIGFLQQISRHQGFLMYRGQADWRWPLTPSIARYAKRLSGGYSKLRDAEAHLLEEFIKVSVPVYDLRRVSQIEQLVHCQHYGLPTRLLDWSTNPLKALFFSVENPEYDNVDGAVYMYEPRSWFEGTKHIKEIQSLTAFYPELLNERVAAQDGCFTAFPLPDRGVRVDPLTEENYPEDVVTLESIIVPKAEKRNMRRQLAALGVNQRTMMPGFDGVARWVKSNLSDFAM